MGALGTTKDWMDKLGAQVDADASIDTEASYVKEASYNKGQVVEAASKDVNMLAGLAIPTTFQFLFPKVLLAAWTLLVQCVAKKKDFSQIALGIPRGHGKTTLLKLFILYCVLFTDRHFILVISSTATLAENIIADVSDMLNESNILRLFGDWKMGAELTRQDLKKFGFRGRNIIIAAIGAGGSLRGLNLKNERPDVMIFDDIQTRECADSQLQSSALEKWMVGTAMKAKSPHRCLFIFAGNMFPTPYSILKKLKSNPTWIKFISGAILADGTALWEELRSLESLLQEFDSDIAMGHPEIFFSEVLNDTEAGINTKVDYARIRAWPWQKDELPQGKFIIIDPSANKKGGDDVAIGYFEVYDGTPGMRDVIEEKLSPGNTVRRALLMALTHNCRLIAVESTAYQYSLLYWFGEISKQLGITGIEFVEVYSGSYSKNARITDMMKSLTSSGIDIHDSIRSQVTHQISNWNPLKRDNVDGILDLLAYAPRVLELYGSSIATDSSTEMLESTGAVVEEDNHAF
jgi:hypothetical protein